MNPGRPALDRLRAATGAAHQALDSTLNVVERLAATGARTDMLRRYHALHEAVEPPVTAWLDGVPDLAIGQRCRAGAITEALRIRGAEPARVSPMPVASRAAAFGALYVLEGSTLGGRTILRDLRSRAVDTAGLGFLDPYGARSGAMWRGLVAVLEAELATDEAALAAACAAAQATFALAARCLSDAVARAD